MIIVDVDHDTDTSEEFYETDDMWLYGTQFDCSFPLSECRHHEDILGGSYCEIPSECDIFRMIFSLECDILTFSHILIAICREGSHMIIDRTFSNIASSRVGDLESTESPEKWRKQENPNSNFFDLLSIKGMNTHRSSIHSESAIIPEVYLYAERLDNREKSEHIPYMGYILKGKCLEKKTTGNEREGSILGT